MDSRTIRKLRRYVATLGALGFPFELAAILVADQLRQHGVPITERALDAAFSIK